MRQSGDIKQIGMAFVIFERQSMAKYILEKNKKSKCDDIFLKIRWFFKRLCCGCCGFSYKEIKVKHPPEPTDIEWKNLARSWCYIFYKRISVFFWVGVVMAASFGIITAVTLR